MRKAPETSTLKGHLPDCLVSIIFWMMSFSNVSFPSGKLRCLLLCPNDKIPTWVLVAAMFNLFTNLRKNFKVFWKLFFLLVVSIIKRTSWECCLHADSSSLTRSSTQNKATVVESINVYSWVTNTWFYYLCSNALSLLALQQFWIYS